MKMVESIAPIEPKPLDGALIGRRCLSELFPGVQVSHPEVPSQVLLLQQEPARAQPIFSRETNVGDDELGPATFAFHLGLPGNAEQAILMDNSSGRTCIASSNLKDAKTMQSHHHMKSRDASGSSSRTTKISSALTTAIGMGSASLSIVARLVMISFCNASSPG